MTSRSTNLLAVAIASLPLAATSCHRAPRAEAPFTVAQENRLRQLLREELALASRSLADGDLDPIAQAMVERELANYDWPRELGSHHLQRVIRRARQGTSSYEKLEAIDLSRISSLDAKIKRIIQELQTTRGQFWGSPLAAQLAALGPQAVPLIWENLKAIPAEDDEWAVRRNLGNVLSTMLTAKDEAIILEDIATLQPLLVEAAIRLNLTSAGDYALARLHELNADPSQAMGFETVKLAFHFKGREAVQPALARVPNSPAGPQLFGLVLAHYPDLDVRKELIAASAAPTGQTPYGRVFYTEHMLRRGMPEGLDLAVEALQRKTVGDETLYDWDLEEVRRSIRYHLSKTGSDEELAQWITANRGRLRWNPARQMFE